MTEQEIAQKKEEEERRRKAAEGLSFVPVASLADEERDDAPSPSVWDGFRAFVRSLPIVRHWNTDYNPKSDDEYTIQRKAQHSIKCARQAYENYRRALENPMSDKGDGYREEQAEIFNKYVDSLILARDTFRHDHGKDLVLPAYLQGIEKGSERHIDPKGISLPRWLNEKPQFRTPSEAEFAKLVRGLRESYMKVHAGNIDPARLDEPRFVAIREEYNRHATALFKFVEREKELAAKKALPDGRKNPAELPGRFARAELLEHMLIPADGFLPKALTMRANKPAAPAPAAGGDITDADALAEIAAAGAFNGDDSAPFPSADAAFGEGDVFASEPTRPAPDRDPSSLGSVIEAMDKQGKESPLEKRLMQVIDSMQGTQDILQKQLSEQTELTKVLAANLEREQKKAAERDKAFAELVGQAAEDRKIFQEFISAHSLSIAGNIAALEAGAVPPAPKVVTPATEKVEAKVEPAPAAPEVTKVETPKVEAPAVEKVEEKVEISPAAPEISDAPFEGEEVAHDEVPAVQDEEPEMDAASVEEKIEQSVPAPASEDDHSFEDAGILDGDFAPAKVRRTFGRTGMLPPSMEPKGELTENMDELSKPVPPLAHNEKPSAGRRSVTSGMSEVPNTRSIETVRIAQPSGEVGL